MPELPEVETIRRFMEEYLPGRRIEEVEIINGKFIRNTTPEVFARQVIGARFTSVLRRGKYLVFHLQKGGDPFRIVIHLKMAGRLLAARASDPLAKHTHVIFHLGGLEQLRYVDLRHFGGLYLLVGDLEGPPGLRTLGPEPLSADFSREYVAGRLAATRRRIKSLLLDQTFVAGIGNIYADEALFRARIHPEREARSLSPEEAEALRQSIREVLAEAINHRGTTFATYVDGRGQRGNFAEHLAVYRRQRQACPACGATIERLCIGGRSSHYCPRCQKK